MQNPPPPMLDDEEAVEQLEGHRWHGEEIEGDDHLAVILEESQPAPAGITPALHTLQGPRHGSFGNLEAELLKFSSAQLWPRPFAFEHGNLLSEGEDLNCRVMPTAEEDSDSGQESTDEFEHELYFVACRNAASAGHRRLHCRRFATVESGAAAMSQAYRRDRILSGPAIRA